MTAFAQESRFEFAPPEAPGQWASLVLAVLAHVLLMLALALGVQWRHQTETPTITAELWSKLPEVAAAKLEEPPTPIPESRPVESERPPVPVPLPPPAPPKLQAAPPPPLPSAADIALEREKQKKAIEERKQEERLLLQKQEQKAAKQKAEREKLEREKQDKLQREKLAKLEQEKLQQKEALKKEAERKAEEKRLADAREQDKLKKAQKEAQKEAQKAADAKAKSALDAKVLEAQRQQNLKRMAGLAGASGEATSTGTAMQSSGPSANYAGRIVAKVKPNIVFADEITGNPTAEVEVKTSPDGTIVGRRLVKSSGSKAWDDAVIKALDKTEVLPRDIDGRVPSVMVIAFRPRD